MGQKVEGRIASEDPRVLLAAGHGIYWLVSGIWPIFHLRSFQAVTGPKADEWLVKTVGSLLAVIGGGLLLGARHRRVTPELEAIAIGSALSLTAIDLVYVSKGRMSKIYLLDALVHSALALTWRLVGSDGVSPESRPAR
jgi:hypothetical protein